MVGQAVHGGGGDFDAAAVAQDDDAFADDGAISGLPVDFEPCRLERAALAATGVTGVECDTMAPRVDGARLAPVSEPPFEDKESL